MDFLASSSNPQNMVKKKLLCCVTYFCIFVQNKPSCQLVWNVLWHESPARAALPINMRLIHRKRSTGDNLIYCKHTHTQTNHKSPIIYPIERRRGGFFTHERLSGENQYLSKSICCVLCWAPSDAAIWPWTHHIVDTLQMDKINVDNTTGCEEQIY